MSSGLRCGRERISQAQFVEALRLVVYPTSREVAVFPSLLPLHVESSVVQHIAHTISVGRPKIAHVLIKRRAPIVPCRRRLRAEIISAMGLEEHLAGAKFAHYGKRLQHVWQVV